MFKSFKMSAEDLSCALGGACITKVLPYKNAETGVSLLCRFALIETGTCMQACMKTLSFLLQINPDLSQALPTAVFKPLSAAQQVDLLRMNVDAQTQ